MQLCMRTHAYIDFLYRGVPTRIYLSVDLAVSDVMHVYVHSGLVGGVANEAATVVLPKNIEPTNITNASGDSTVGKGANNSAPSGSSGEKKNKKGTKKTSPWAAAAGGKGAKSKQPSSIPATGSPSTAAAGGKGANPQQPSSIPPRQQVPHPERSLHMRGDPVAFLQDKFSSRGDYAPFDANRVKVLKPVGITSLAATTKPSVSIGLAWS